jgi:hypothetical protein
VTTIDVHLAAAAIADDMVTARDELRRADDKAGYLLGLALGGVTVLLALGPSRHLPLAAVVLGSGAVVAALAGVVLLGWVLWPRLGGRGGGYLAHCRRTPAQILAVLSAPTSDLAAAAQLAHLARLAELKFRLIRRAEVAMAAGLALAVASAVLR